MTIPWAVLVTIGIAALLGAAIMHAVVASLEQIPHARERQIAAHRRPDGRPTTAARLASLPDHSDNASSVVYTTLEALAMVCWTIFAWGIGERLGWGFWPVFLLAVGLAALQSLVVVRSVPRTIARAFPESALRTLAPVAWGFVWLSTPLRRLLPALSMPALAEAEDLVEQAEGALDADDATLLRGVVNLGDTLTREVMVPRTDMITIAAGTEARKALLLFMRSGFSRVPVTGEDADDVRGLLYLKDVVRATWDHPELLDEPLDAHMRDAVFIPESVPADDLLRRMQSEVFHMAIVVDEYGGVAGLVTIEDALEEIVGELVDEHDRTEPSPEQLADDVFRVPARLPLDDLGELFGLEIEDDDVETVGGLLAKSLGKVPIPGARASAHGLSLLAERAEGRRRRLTWVIVEREPDPDEEDQ